MIEDTLKERQKVHGSFSSNAEMAQILKREMRGGKNWTALNYEQKQALEMIVGKMGRILAGDHNHSEHWHDISGYGTLGENACVGRKNPK